MKKFLSLMLVLALVLSFTACKGTPRKTFTRGVVSDNSYESEFLGLGFKAGDGWYFYTEEEIAALYGVVSDQLEDFEEYLKNATVVYDMQAMETATGNNVGINFEKLTPITEPQLGDMKSHVAKLMPTVANALEQAGCTDVSYEPFEVEIDGKTFYGGKTTALLSGVELVQAFICVKCDGYLASITVSTVGSDSVSKIFDNFYVID